MADKQRTNLAKQSEQTKSLPSTRLEEYEHIERTSTKTIVAAPDPSKNKEIV